MGTLSCPRCGRLNDRSPVIRGLKILAAIFFLGVAAWAVWMARTTETPPSADGKPMPKERPTLPGQRDSSQPDLRF